MSDLSMNQRIAELCGWTEIQAATVEHGGYGFQTYEMDVIVGRAPDSKILDVMPDYEHDLNAVIAALPEGFDIQTDHYQNDWQDHIEYSVALIAPSYRQIVPGSWSGAAATIQEAAAKALLAYLTWKAAQP